MLAFRASQLDREIIQERRPNPDCLLVRDAFEIRLSGFREPMLENRSIFRRESAESYADAYSRKFVYDFAVCVELIFFGRDSHVHFTTADKMGRRVDKASEPTECGRGGDNVC